MNRRGKINMMVDIFGFIPFVSTIGGHIKLNHLHSLYLSEEAIKQGESSFEDLKIIVDNFEKKHPQRFADNKAKIEKLLNEAPLFRDRDDKDVVRYKLLFDQFGRGFSPEEVILYNIYDAPVEIKKTFSSARETAALTIRLNDLKDAEILNNKGLTYGSFKKYFKREAIYISKEKDRDTFLDYTKKHPIFVKKAVYEAMGRSVELIDLNTDAKDINCVFNELIKEGPHLIEERVSQSQDISELNSSSVNTIRAITFNTKHGIEDPFYFMKIGRGGSFVDNGGAGGLFVGIDRSTGTLITDGFDEMGHVYETHPDTGTRFKGFQLPEWESMKSICKEMSSCIPSVKFIGWDMAHTDKGWVLIEGNGSTQLIGPQSVFKRGVKKDVERILTTM